MPVIILLLLLFLSACGDRDSNYEALTSLQGEQRLQQFKAHPVPERIRLYNKIYEKSGHPHDAELSIGFDDKPAETLTYILSDLKSSSFSDFMRYVPVIYSISRQPNFDICEPQRIGSLKRILNSYHLDSRQLSALEGLKFQKCQLV